MVNLKYSKMGFQDSATNFAIKLSGKLKFTKRQRILLFVPPILLVTTYVAFTLLAEFLGPISGYLGGFSFYWTIWCGLIPILVVDNKELKELFRASDDRFGKPKWVGILFLVGPFVSPFVTMFLPKVGDATLVIFLVSALFAVTNGTMEEVLWRGSFIKTFPNSWLWSYIYPSVWFGYWHISPQTIFPSNMPGGVLAFATLSIFMGLTFGWVSKKTGSIRWTIIAHILTDFMGLAGMAIMGGGY